MGLDQGNRVFTNEQRQFLLFRLRPICFDNMWDNKRNYKTLSNKDTHSLFTRQCFFMFTWLSFTISKGSDAQELRLQTEMYLICF